jgi:4,4'-dithiodibutanoate disulfide reductase
MVKMNLADGNVNGVTVSDSCATARAFADVGVDILALSGGLILENGLYMLRGKVPLQNMIEACRHDFIKKCALFLFGPLIIPYMPYSEMFFRAPARCVLETIKQWNRSNRKKKSLSNDTNTDADSSSHSVKVCYIGGVQTYSSLEKVISQDGFDFVQCGRALLHDPQIVREWEKEGAKRLLSRGSGGLEESAAMVDSGCTRCNKCIVDATMKQAPISCAEW